jgi:hypothetical protein
LNITPYAAYSNNNDTVRIATYIRKELNAGFVFDTEQEREEIRSDVTREYEEARINAFKFRLIQSNWDFLSSNQLYWDYFFEAGPFWGNGNLTDSSAINVIDATHKIIGFKGMAGGHYNNRFYHDRNIFTLISVDALSRVYLYGQEAEGTVLDTNNINSPYTDRSQKLKFRIGFHAKAGWGIGRLNPVDHLVTATRFLEKYYPKRVFINEEIEELAREIGDIKGLRDWRKKQSSPLEIKQLTEFIRRNMLLEVPVDAQNFWQLTEFRPRYAGTIFTFGPFFRYLNYEPDFVYGGYLELENNKYYNTEWNRIFRINLAYNSYKREDWLLMETELGMSFFPNLNSEYSFGIKYLPALGVRDIEDFGPLRHNIIHYVHYFSQINSRYRIDISLALRIAPNDQFLMPGPGFSVYLYRSRY